MKKLDITDQWVTKSNALIQQSRFDLTLQQQKIVLYIISQIKPDDEDFRMCEFNIVDFCRICGIDHDSGRNYDLLRQQLKAIRDKSIWVKLPDGRETTVAWIEKPYLDDGGGKIQIRLDRDMMPFLLQLKENYTRYQLIYTLHFKSKYSIRLYELVKSFHFHELDAYSRRYSLETIQRVMGAEKYALYRDFKRRALDPAVREINEYSDKDLTYKEIKQGRRVIGVEFTVMTKETLERMQIVERIERDMGAEQLVIWDMVEGIDI